MFWKENMFRSQRWFYIPSVKFAARLIISPQSLICPNCKCEFAWRMDGQRHHRTSEENQQLRSYFLIQKWQLAQQSQVLRHPSLHTYVLWWSSDTATSSCSTHIRVRPLLRSANEMTHKTLNRWWCLCNRDRYEGDLSPMSMQQLQRHHARIELKLTHFNFKSFNGKKGCAATHTVVMEQSTVFHSLLHVIQLHGLVFASCDNEPLAGCYGGDGCCVGVMREVRFGGPLLHDNRKYELWETLMTPTRWNQGETFRHLRVSFNET